MKKIRKRNLSKYLCSILAIAMLAQSSILVFATSDNEISASDKAEVETITDSTSDQDQVEDEADNEQDLNEDEDSTQESTKSKPEMELPKRPNWDSASETKDSKKQESEEKQEKTKEEKTASKSTPILLSLQHITEDGEGYTYSDGVVTIVQDGKYELAASSDIIETQIVIQSGVTASIQYPIIDMESDGSAITVEDGATLTLDGNILFAYARGDSAAVRCMPGGTLIFAADSGIEAWAIDGAGVGGNKNETPGTIIFRDRALTAIRSNNGAGIGGGSGADGGTILIEDEADIISYSDYGSGIGGGKGGSAGTITIRDEAYVYSCSDSGTAIGVGINGKEGSISLLGGTIIIYSYDNTALGGEGTQVCIKEAATFSAYSFAKPAITASSQTGSTKHLIYATIEDKSPFPNPEETYYFIELLWNENDWEAPFFGDSFPDITKSFAGSVKPGEYTLYTYEDDVEVNEHFYYLVDQNNPDSLTISSSTDLLSPIPLIFKEMEVPKGHFTNVTFHANDGTNKTSVKPYQPDSMIALPDAAKLFDNEKTFLYWTTKPDGGKCYDTLDEVQTEGDSMEFYAQWKTDGKKDPVDPKKSSKPSDSKDPKPTNTGGGNQTITTATGNSPKTADQYSGIWWMMVIASVAGLTTCFVRMRKYSK